MMSIEEIIKKYPKTDDCELQTLGELQEWQIFELRRLITNLLENQKRNCSNDLQFMESGKVDLTINTFENTELPFF